MLSNEPAVSAYERFEWLTQAATLAETNAIRRTVLTLAIGAAMHPALKPFREDPLIPLDGRFISLDARIAATRAMFDSLENLPEIVGSVHGALYLPALESASVCRVHVAYLSGHPIARWGRPTPLSLISQDLDDSAQQAFEAAVHLLTVVSPGETPPVPASLFWDITGAEEEILVTTAGDSLQLPLMIAFLSALTGLPISVDTGATGAIQPPGRVAPVRFVDKKREAFIGRFGDDALFLTPEDGNYVRDVVLKLGQPWKERFALAKTRNSSSLPVGVTPTFLCAEVENAPMLWANQASLFRSALTRYESIFLDTVERYGGIVFSASGHSGEGMGAAFADPVRAVDAAVHLLQATRAAMWDSAFGDSLPVRVGIDTGYGELSGGLWRGVGPSQSLRIARSASAYQILASGSVHSAVKPSGWVSHGTHRLRDLADPMTLWQVTASGIQAVSVPPESLDTRHHNLPTTTSSLIGREEEIEALVGLLVTERFITLTGAGGVGKTRLAIAVAERALFASETAERFADGAFYISLDDGIRNEAEIARAVCEAGSIAKIDALSSKRVLLILDNAERATGAITRFIESVWSVAQNVTFLVTSRIPIRFRGEKRVRVLSLPVPKRDVEEQDWERVPSIQLFLNRARDVNADFAIVTQSGRDALARLVRRLDGLPLAIELAAARTRHLSVGEIETRVGDSLRLLSTREPGMSERHRTLLATLEWSFALLPDAEKQLLRRISVFVGGFSADAAENVMDGDPDTLDRLASLEEQSLLVRHRTELGDPPRFILLQTVSDFAKIKRVEFDGDLASEKHAEYFVHFAERNGGEEITLSPREAESFDALDRDMANLRATWSYLLKSNDAGRLVRFAVSLTDFLRRRGHFRERFEWVTSALAVTKEDDQRRSLLHAHSITLRDTGNLPEAIRVAEELQELVRNIGDSVRLADAVALQATNATRAKEFAKAESLFDDAEALYQVSNHKRGMATVSSNRGFNALLMTETERARGLLESALSLYHDIADEQGKAYAHTNLGYLLSEAGDYAAAKSHYLHHLNYCRSNADTWGCAISLFNLGEAMLYLGQISGLPLVIAAAEIFTRIGHPNAGPASSECEKWSDKTNTAQGVFAAMRRAASRRTLAELRESHVGD